MVQVKSLLVSLLVLFSVLAPARAESQRVRSLKILVDLQKDGTAQVYEQWDVATGDRITEWYLVRENLGDITIDSLEVCVDEVPLHNEGEWNVDRNLEQKAGKCGIVHKYNGVELCWGVGSHGDHVFEALYDMHGAVKSARDYDYLHLQLVSPGLSSPPEKVRVFIQSDQVQLDTTVARVWGFGYEGICIFEHGRVVMEGDSAFDSEDSVIVLLRLDKGILEPTSTRDQDFQEVLDRAMEGADFGTDEEEEDLVSGLLGLGFIGLIVWWVRRRMKKLRSALSGKPQKLFKQKDIVWYRDIPLNGHLPAAERALKQAGEGNSDMGPLCSALILRMVYNGYLEVSRLAEGKESEIRFTAKDPNELDAVSKQLYQMLKKAAGENAILEKKEFSTWSREHKDQANSFSVAVEMAGSGYLKENGYMSSSYRLTTSGKQEALHLLGLKQYLSEFTLSQEREAFEVHLWKEYLVYASLFGIADVVAKQLKDIAPEWQKMESVLEVSRDFSRVVTTAAALYNQSRYSSYTSSSHSYSSSSSRSGYGGHSSHSGGHGYSGGGRGGGGR